VHRQAAQEGEGEDEDVKKVTISSKAWWDTLWKRCVTAPQRERKERHTARNLAKRRL